MKPWVTTFGLGMVSFLVYVISSTMQPTGYADADELLITGSSFSVAHPPGYALQTTLYYGVSQLIPWLPPAESMTLLSNALAAGSVVLLYLLLKRLDLHFFKQASGAMPLITAGIFGLSYLWWLYATVTEIAVLTVFLSVALFNSGVLWLMSTPHSIKWFLVSCVLFGLLVSHYALAITLIPGLLLLLVLRFRETWKWWLPGIGVSMATFMLVNALLLVQNIQPAYFSWNFSPSLAGWWHHLLLTDYYGSESTTPISATNPFNSLLTTTFYSSVSLYLSYLIQHFTVGGFMVGLIGIVMVVLKKNRVLLPFVAMWVFSGLYLSGYMQISLPNFNQDIMRGVAQRQFLLSEVIFSIFIWWGIKEVEKRKEGKGLVLGVILLVWVAIANRGVLINKSFRTLVNQVYSSALETVEPSALIICTTDISCYNLAFNTTVSRLRPDVLVVPLTSDYVKRFLTEHPEIYPFTNLNDQDFVPQLIAWNLPKRPVYMTEGIPDYVDYAGFEVGPLYVAPTGWLLKVSLTPFESSPTNFYETSLLNQASTSHSKDTFGQGILHTLGNSLAYNGYLQLQNGNATQAASILATAAQLDDNNEQTQYMRSHLEELADELLIDPKPITAAEYAAAAVEALDDRDMATAERYYRRAFYIEPTNQKTVTALQEIYRLMRDEKRVTVFTNYLAYLQKNNLDR